MPSEYVHDHVRATFIEDPPGIRDRHEIGLDKIMWSTDYPHTNSNWPNSQRIAAYEFRDVPEPERRQIMRDNALRQYGLDEESTMTVAKLDAPGFWDLGPEVLKVVREAAAPFELRLSFFALGDPDDPSTAVANMLEMPPNFVLPRHAHDCERLEIVVRGTLEVDGEILHPGDISVARPMEMYGPHVAGP